MATSDEATGEALRWFAGLIAALTLEAGSQKAPCQALTSFPRVSAEDASRIVRDQVGTTHSPSPLAPFPSDVLIRFGLVDSSLPDSLRTLVASSSSSHIRIRLLQALRHGTGPYGIGCLVLGRELLLQARHGVSSALQSDSQVVAEQVLAWHAAAVQSAHLRITACSRGSVPDEASVASDTAPGGPPSKPALPPGPKVSSMPPVKRPADAAPATTVDPQPLAKKKQQKSDKIVSAIPVKSSAPAASGSGVSVSAQPVPAPRPALASPPVRIPKKAGRTSMPAVQDYSSLCMPGVFSDIGPLPGGQPPLVGSKRKAESSLTALAPFTREDSRAYRGTSGRHELSRAAARHPSSLQFGVRFPEGSQGLEKRRFIETKEQMNMHYRESAGTDGGSTTPLVLQNDHEGVYMHSRSAVDAGGRDDDGDNDGILDDCDAIAAVSDAEDAVLSKQLLKWMHPDLVGALPLHLLFNAANAGPPRIAPATALPLGPELSAAQTTPAGVIRGPGASNNSVLGVAPWAHARRFRGLDVALGKRAARALRVDVLVAAQTASRSERADRTMRHQARFPPRFVAATADVEGIAADRASAEFRTENSDDLVRRECQWEHHDDAAARASNVATVSESALNIRHGPARGGGASSSSTTSIKPLTGKPPDLATPVTLPVPEAPSVSVERAASLLATLL